METGSDPGQTDAVLAWDVLLRHYLPSARSAEPPFHGVIEQSLQDRSASVLNFAQDMAYPLEEYGKPQCAGDVEESTWQHERGSESIINGLRRISRSGDRSRDPAIAFT